MKVTNYFESTKNFLLAIDFLQLDYIHYYNDALAYAIRPHACNLIS